MNINEILQKTVELKASDLHITVGLPPMMRVNGMLIPHGKTSMTPEDTREMMLQVLNEAQVKTLEKRGEVDLSYHLQDISRFRVNVFRQKGYYSLAFRVISEKIPTIEELHLPDVLKELSLRQNGLILVTGPTGSGKSTTLAAMINHINKNRNCHIIALEDPIEYLHNHNKSMINQREIGKDSMQFSAALRAALREDPDVIFVGEMRDAETMSIAVTAAETGHLVMSTLHTSSADKTVDRIIDVFPPQQQQQIRTQLSSVLKGTIAQKLLPTADGTGRVAALEIMITNNAVSNLIREGKTHQLHSTIQSGMKAGMRTLDYSLSELLQRRTITRETAFFYADDQEMLKAYLSGG